MGVNVLILMVGTDSLPDGDDDEGTFGGCGGSFFSPPRGLLIPPWRRPRPVVDDDPGCTDATGLPILRGLGAAAGAF